MSQKFRIWISAARPQTLAAAFTPVITGAALSFRHNMFDTAASLVALICAALIQIGTNFANDYYDYVKGADTDSRVGFKRATSSGLITQEEMKRATFFTMACAFLLGMYLVWHAGWVILLIGILSIIFGILYTGGPYPLAYNGLGDLFVLLFFGYAAVMGTYYVNALQWSADSFWASLAIGALAVNILVVNNLRDLEQDRESNKRTLGVLLGGQALRYEYLLMLFAAYAVPIVFYFGLNYDFFILLPFITIPSAVRLLWEIWNEEQMQKLNLTLERTAKFMAFYGILFSIGIIAA